MSSRPSRPRRRWPSSARAWLELTVADDGTVYGVYSHDSGIIMGHYEDGLLLGQWCELPTRRGPDDGGPLQLRFARSNHKIQLNGRWTYGESPEATWRDDFHGSTISEAPPSELVARLHKHELCPK